jgi:hypothetical protein
LRLIDPKKSFSTHACTSRFTTSSRSIEEQAS